MSLKAVVKQKIMNEVIKQKKGLAKELNWRVLVLDQQAMRIVSACCKMHEISAEGIAIVEDINISREPLPKLEAVYLITPTEKSVDAFIKDFSGDYIMYRSAHVYFTEACPDWLFEKLRKDQITKYIQTLKEINVAFIPYESQVFSLDSPETFQCVYNQTFAGNRVANLERIAEQIATLCATLGEYPSICYRSDFEKNAELAQLVQQKLDAYKADEPTMGEGPEKARSQLIILDRGFDCVSPLLHELTLQAMAYDLLPIENDVYKYKTSSSTEVKVILNEENEMWVQLRHEHIGHVLKVVPENVKKFTTSKMKDTTSMVDLNQLIKKLPHHKEELRKCQTLLSLAENCFGAWQGRMQCLCNVEQDLATGTDIDGERIKDHMPNIVPILLDQAITNYDKMRIILLYIFSRNGISEENLNKLVQHAQILPQEKQAIVNMGNLGVNVVVEGKAKDVYQIPRKDRSNEQVKYPPRWTPVLKDLIEDAIQDKLDPSHFPYLKVRSESSTQQFPMSARYGQWNKPFVRHVPRIIIFCVGGISFSEIRSAYEVAAANNKWEVIVGSSHIMTPEGFLTDLANLSA
ncbi:protein ROP-like [Macrosteles quadrilineatus]|uniref:protein ROP-like n=1 Tax=Macrosteles quadrilineatus TaxID=74068 RepID=UPI0023E0D510|nr:protein ROP-like [Macrosteles quadrilineatus]